MHIKRAKENLDILKGNVNSKYLDVGLGGKIVVRTSRLGKLWRNMWNRGGGVDKNVLKKAVEVFKTLDKEGAAPVNPQEKDKIINTLTNRTVVHNQKVKKTQPQSTSSKTTEKVEETVTRTQTQTKILSPQVDKPSQQPNIPQKQSSLQQQPNFHPEQLNFITNPQVPEIVDAMIKNQDNSGYGYPISGVDFLMMHYLTKAKGVFISSVEGEAGSNVEIGGKVAFTFNFKFSGDAQDFSKLTNFLRNEIALHPDNRPAKIIINCSLWPPGKQGHTVILVIEPDQRTKNKANITIVNPHGNTITSYHSMEQQILNAASQAYNDTNTSLARNQKATFTGGYCGVDGVENARYLASIPDVQSHIKQNKLPIRTPDQIKQFRVDHASELVKYKTTSLMFSFMEIFPELVKKI